MRPTRGQILRYALWISMGLTWLSFRGCSGDHAIIAGAGPFFDHLEIRKGGEWFLDDVRVAAFSPSLLAVNLAVLLGCGALYHRFHRVSTFKRRYLRHATAGMGLAWLVNNSFLVHPWLWFWVVVWPIMVVVDALPFASEDGDLVLRIIVGLHAMVLFACCTALVNGALWGYRYLRSTSGTAPSGY